MLDLYPPFREKLDKLLAACAARGATYVVISSYRSSEEQDKLYAQGRTTPGKIVTNGQGGSSAHNFKIAVDLCADKSPASGLQADWSVGAYAILAEEARKLDLETGADYQKLKDYGHIQLPIHAKGLTYDILNTWLRNGGFPELFARLDKYGW